MEIKLLLQDKSDLRLLLVAINTIQDIGLSRLARLTDVPIEWKAETLTEFQHLQGIKLQLLNYEKGG